MKLIEYLKLIPKGLSNPQAILEGWMNDLKMERGELKEDEIAEVIRRRAICHTCPFMDKNAKSSDEYFKLTGSYYTSKRLDDHCTFCGCPMSKKTAALSSNCGIEDWNEVNPENQLKLKWTKYK